MNKTLNCIFFTKELAEMIAAKEILKIDKKSKIIFVSADKNIRDEALTIGATSFKKKPCPINLLKNNIIKALKASEKY